jgi:cytoskeleton-associated protein 5
MCLFCSTLAEFSKELEFNSREAPSTPIIETSPRRASNAQANPEQQEKLSRLHDIFQYRSSTLSNESSQGRITPTT